MYPLKLSVDTLFRQVQLYTPSVIQNSVCSVYVCTGLSIWYGEDLTPSLTASKSLFAFQGWDFLMHEILHKSVYNPVKTSHFYAGTLQLVSLCLGSGREEG